MIDLRLGDCLEVMKTLPDGCVDAVITDPPYGIDFKYNGHDDDPEKYAVFMRQFITEAQRLVVDGPVFVWQAMKNAGKWHEWFPSGYRIFAACRAFTQWMPTPVQYSWDPVIWWGNPKTKPSVYNKDYHEQRKAPFGKNRERIPHPCPRPIEQVRYVVELVTLEGMIILDPFMGSGTTGLAAINTGRNFIGIEKVPEYYDIARKRIEAAQQQLTLELA
jgi:site-specific DNA-methyltransferase (adenine-specific)